MFNSKPVFPYSPLAALGSLIRLRPLRLLNFLFTQRVRGFTVPDEPCFDSAESTAWFRSALLASKAYVEFGSGGSTFLAARERIPFVAIDSDRFFLGSVRAKIAAAGLLDENRQEFRYVDIGLTGPWGKPVVPLPPSAARLEAFRQYSAPPAQCVAGRFTPDLVLVDGRFRVACALKMLQLLENRTGWTLVIDDYVGRPGYHVVETFAKLDRLVGRMAVFKETTGVGGEALASAIRQYELVAD